MSASSPAEIRQLTHDPRNHDLDNNQNFTRDGKWLLYDTRNPGIAESRTVEKINIETGQVVVLYDVARGARGEVNGAGAASFSPTDDRVAFIHGPWTADGLPYDFTRRRGGLVAGDGGTGFAFADARDITRPFTPGALRGGTHRHEWDGSGQWLGFTYNDDIMKKADKDLRTIGVTKLGSPVKVLHPQESLFEGDGEGFSALVVRVTSIPKAGTDEINRAAQDVWVGARGYRRSDGTRQRARAFVGSLIAENGAPVDEVFVVDIPEDITRQGETGPLEGTLDDFPAPPKGCSQRRLTWTVRWEHPGVVGNCCSGPEGDWITFLANDENSVPQTFAISPTGGVPVQVTHSTEGIAASPRWSPDGKKLVTVTKNGQLILLDAPGAGSSQVSTLYAPGPGEPHPVKPVFSPDSKTLAFNCLVKDEKGEWLQVFVTRVQ